MLKKTIEYTDFDGNKRKEDFYFNLTKAEILEMEMSINGGLTGLLMKIIKEQNQSEIVKFFKEIILKSYGEKSNDGRRFIKNDEVRDSFSQTEAYSNLFMELATNADAAVAFVDAIIPVDVDKDKFEEMKKELSVE